MIQLSFSACTHGSIRLQGGSDSSTGRVEICHNDIWGTVCDDFWSSTNARVACTQLGFSPAGKELQFAMWGARLLLPEIADAEVLTTGFTNGVGVIWMDNVQCHGTEMRLIDCPRTPLGSHNCIHTEDVGVRCLPGLSE